MGDRGVSSAMRPLAIALYVVAAVCLCAAAVHDLAGDIAQCTLSDARAHPRYTKLADVTASGFVLVANESGTETFVFAPYVAANAHLYEAIDAVDCDALLKAFDVCPTATIEVAGTDVEGLVIPYFAGAATSEPANSAARLLLPLHVLVNRAEAVDRRIELTFLMWNVVDAIVRSIRAIQDYNATHSDRPPLSISARYLDLEDQIYVDIVTFKAYFVPYASTQLESAPMVPSSLYTDYTRELTLKHDPYWVRAVLDATLGWVNTYALDYEGVHDLLSDALLVDDVDAAVRAWPDARAVAAIALCDQCTLQATTGYFAAVPILPLSHQSLFAIDGYLSEKVGLHSVRAVLPLGDAAGLCSALGVSLKAHARVFMTQHEFEPLLLLDDRLQRVSEALSQSDLGQYVAPLVVFAQQLPDGKQQVAVVSAVKPVYRVTNSMSASSQTLRVPREHLLLFANDLAHAIEQLHYVAKLPHGWLNEHALLREDEHHLRLAPFLVAPRETHFCLKDHLSNGVPPPTAAWIAPERYDAIGADDTVSLYAADIWSFGHLLMVAMGGVPSFVRDTGAAVVSGFDLGSTLVTVSYTADSVALVYTFSTPLDDHALVLAPLVTACLSQDAAMRPSIGLIVADAVFRPITTPPISIPSDLHKLVAHNAVTDDGVRVRPAFAVCDAIGTVVMNPTRAFTRGTKLSDGSVGTAVYSVLQRHGGSAFALKVIQPTSHRDDAGVAAAALHEYAVMRTVQAHAYIMPVYGAYAWKEDGLWMSALLLPVAAGDALTFRQSLNRPMTRRELSLLLGAVLTATYHVHSHGYLHLDIKAENVLRLYDAASSSYRWVLADFGLARRINAVPRDFSTTPALQGPEFYAPVDAGTPFNANITPAADVYAIGLLALMLIEGQSWVNLRGLDVLTGRRELVRNYLSTVGVPRPLHSLSDEYGCFIAACTHPLWQYRPHLADLARTPLLYDTGVATLRPYYGIQLLNTLYTVSGASLYDRVTLRRVGQWVYTDMQSESLSAILTTASEHYLQPNGIVQYVRAHAIPQADGRYELRLVGEAYDATLADLSVTPMDMVDMHAVSDAVTTALDRLHQSGMVHCAITPDSIFVDLSALPIAAYFGFPATSVPCTTADDASAVYTVLNAFMTPP